MSFTNQQPWSGLAGAPDGIVMVRTANFMTLLSGSPVNVLAGQSGSASVPPDMVWDWTNKALYICTQSSSDPLATIWTEIEFVGPFVGTDVTCVSLTATGSIVDDGTLLVQGATTLSGNVTASNNLSVGGSLSVTGPATVGPLTALSGGTLGGVFTGSPTFNFPLHMTQPITLANNVFITSADTAGTYRVLIGTDTGNQTYVRNAGGANTGFLNQAGSQWLLLSDNAGNVQVPAGSFYSAGAITTPSTVQAGYVHSTGNLQVDGSAQVNGQLNTYGGIYPHNGIYNIGGYAGFSFYLAGGNPTIQFAGGQYIQYNGNINYATAGAHVFTGVVDMNNGLNVTGNVGFGNNLNVYGNAAVSGDLTSNTMEVAGQLTAGGMHTPGSFAADGPSVFNSNLTVYGTGFIGGAGTVGGPGWYYNAIGTTHAFLFWYNSSSTQVFCRVDNGSDFGPLNYVSDARLKENVQRADVDCLKLVREVELSSFQWKASGEAVPLGFTTKQLREVLPAAINEQPADAPPFPDADGIFYESVNMNVMLAMLVGAVQQLAARLE